MTTCGRLSPGPAPLPRMLIPRMPRPGCAWQALSGSFWNVRGHFSEGRQHLRRALAREGAQEATAARARALDSAGKLAFNQGDHTQARALHEEALAIFRTAGDRTGIANTLSNLGNLSAPSSQRGLL